MHVELDCMGERHEVRLVRESLVFSGHTVKELELLDSLGERSGCARFLRAWRQRDVDTLRALGQGEEVLKKIHADADISRGREATRKIRQPDREWRRKNLLTSAIFDLWCLVGREKTRLDLGTGASWTMWLAVRSWPDRRCKLKDTRRWVVSPLLSSDGWAAEPAEVEICVWFGLQWYRHVWSRGMALVDNRLVLAKREDWALEILDLSSPSLVSLAVLRDGGIERTEPLMAPTSGGCGVSVRFGKDRTKSNNTGRTGLRPDKNAV